MRGGGGVVSSTDYMYLINLTICTVKATFVEPFRAQLLDTCQQNPAQESHGAQDCKTSPADEREGLAVAFSCRYASIPAAHT